MARDLLAAVPDCRRWLMARLAPGLAAALPGSALRVLAYAGGTLAWWLDPAGRRRVAARLAAAVPPGSPLARAVRRCYTDFALTLAEMALLAQGAWPRPGMLEMHDPFRVFAARPLAGPAILVTVHSHWDLLAAALHQLRLTDGILAPTLSYGDPELDAWLAARRQRWGCRTVLLERAPLALLRALHEGSIIGLLMDRDYGGHGIEGRFLGRRQRLPTGPAALAVQSGAPLIPLFLARRGWSRFALLVGRPLRPPPLPSRGERVLALTRQAAAALGRLLAAAPAQWVAFHDETHAHRDRAEMGP